MDRAPALILTLLVGALVATQPPANALLARHVGDLGAAFTSLLLSTLIVGVLLVAAGEVSQLHGLTAFRPEHALGAIAGAAVVLVSLVAVRSLGALGVTAALVVTQLTVSAVIDRLGVLGLRDTPLSSARLAGVVLLVAGTFLVTSR
jgi:bacterial/archaeal transporter family-2 protein